MVHDLSVDRVKLCKGIEYRVALEVLHLTPIILLAIIQYMYTTGVFFFMKVKHYNIYLTNSLVIKKTNLVNIVFLIGDKSGTIK